MKKRTLIAPILVLICSSVLAEEPLTAKVLGQRVNMRAKADLNSEVVGQLAAGDTLIVKSELEGWVEIRPPESVDLWVSRDLVAEDKIAVNKANVRAGPGINYTVVGVLQRGDAIVSKGTFGEWVRIAPFDGSSLWVNKDLLEVQYPLRESPSPEPAVVEAPETIETPSSAEAEPAQPPEPMPMSGTSESSTGKSRAKAELIPLEGQGQSVEREGILKPAPYKLNQPSPFRLARKEGDIYVTVCYLKGNKVQLEGLRNQYLRVKGRQYWVQGGREPLLTVDSIQRLRDF